MLAIENPSTPLNVRKVKVLDEHVGRLHRNTYVAFSRYIDDYLNNKHQANKEPQRLRVDALVEAELNERARPVYLLNELQVDEQDFARRLFSYIAKILGGEPINQSKNKFPSSVYACGICVYDYSKNDGEEKVCVKRLPIWNSNKIDPVYHPNKEGLFVEIEVCNIFLGQLCKVGDGSEVNTKIEKRERLKECIVAYFESVALEQHKIAQNEKDIRERCLENLDSIGEILDCLGKLMPENQDFDNLPAEQKVDCLLGPGGPKEVIDAILSKKLEEIEEEQFRNEKGQGLNERFNGLTVEQKKAYLWLELISFAHVMSAKDVRTSLEILPEEDRRGLEQAYDELRLDINLLKEQSMDQINSKFPGFSEELVRKLLEDDDISRGLAEIREEKDARIIADSIILETKKDKYSEGDGKYRLPKENLDTLLPQGNSKLSQRVLKEIVKRNDNDECYTVDDESGAFIVTTKHKKDESERKGGVTLR